MSLTPGWKPKAFKAYTPGIPVSFSITVQRARPKTGGAGPAVGCYYLDNGSEFKEFPETKEGWRDLCDELKNFEP
jgi:hypothetical protein